MNWWLIALVVMAVSGWIAAIWLAVLLRKARKERHELAATLQESIELHGQAAQLMVQMRDGMSQRMAEHLAEMDLPGPPN